MLCLVLCLLLFQLSSIPASIDHLTFFISVTTRKNLQTKTNTAVSHGCCHVHAVMHATDLRLDLTYLLLNRVVAALAQQHATANATLVISIKATSASMKWSFPCSFSGRYTFPKLNIWTSHDKIFEPTQGFELICSVYIYFIVC